MSRKGRHTNCRKDLLSLLLASVACTAQHQDVLAQQQVSGTGGAMQGIELKARPFALKQVDPLDGPFKDAMERGRRYLHELDPDRLLHTWRNNAGLRSNAKPLGGWERPNCEVRGHMLLSKFQFGGSRPSRCLTKKSRLLRLP